MLSKRIVVCLDVKNGELTKGIKFLDNINIGDPVESAGKYSAQGIDEIVFYDITASVEKRGIFLDVVEKVAEKVFVPLCVGGGIASVEDMRAVLLAGAEKISINSAAVLNPDLISQGAKAFGSQAIVVGMDILKVNPNRTIPSGYEVVINGGKKAMNIDALSWAKKCEELGAGELCLNSIDADGTKEGYELNLNKLIAQAVSLPIIASGGAGNPEHVYDTLTKGQSSAALVASIVHFEQYSIKEIKDYSSDRGVPMRLYW